VPIAAPATQYAPNVARLILPSIGSASWQQLGPDWVCILTSAVHHNESVTPHSLRLCQERAVTAFVYDIRRIVRAASAVCYISVPTHLVSASLVKQLEHAADVVLRINSFTDMSWHSTVDPQLQDYDGLLIVERLAHLNGLVGHVPDRDGWRHLLKVFSCFCLSCYMASNRCLSSASCAERT